METQATEIKGFLEDTRCFGPVVFLIVRKATCYESIGAKFQFVVKDPLLIPIAKDLVRESYITIKGKLEPIQKSPLPSYETSSIKCSGPTTTISGDSLIKPRTRPYVEFDVVEYRRKEYHKIALANDILKRSIRSTLQEQGFIELITPKLLSGFTEGGAELFKVEHQPPLYLSQSPQLHKQAAINMGLQKVFEIGPVYRAEKFKTPRHLNQTICWDMEMSTEDMFSIIDIIKKVIIKGSQALNERFSDIQLNVEEDFKIVKYNEVISMLGMSPGQGLTIEQERRVPRLYNCKYVFITHYPKAQKPFYIKGEESFDLVCSTGELASGGLRENNYKQLLSQIQSRNINSSSLDWYLNMFKLGTPISGGVGLGFDRLISYFLKLTNIKYCKIF